MPLFHRAVGFPRTFQPPRGAFRLRYTEHAWGEARRDKYGDLTSSLPDEIDVDESVLVEVELGAGGSLLKLVYRCPLDGRRDLVLVVQPDGIDFLVRTVWANLTSDHHKTLRLEAYADVQGDGARIPVLDVSRSLLRRRPVPV